jgi:anthranilate 1,2-dioxygenase small subunit
VIVSDVYALIERYGRLLDEDRLEIWLDLFAEHGHYEIVSRENRMQNLPLSLMLCDNKDMLRDRVHALRHANIFNIHHDCHVIGLVHAEASGPGCISASAAYSLFQSNQDGESRLFSVGRYHFGLVQSDAGLLIEKAVVVVDTGTIQTLLATPI